MIYLFFVFFCLLCSYFCVTMNLATLVTHYSIFLEYECSYKKKTIKAKFCAFMLKWRAEVGGELEDSGGDYCWVPGIGVWDRRWGRRRRHICSSAKPCRWFWHQVRCCSLQMYESFTLFLSWTRFIWCTGLEILLFPFVLTN